MSEAALRLWHGVLFRQRPDLTFESINPHVQQWTGVPPERALDAVYPADRAKVDADQANFRLRHARTWQITWVEQRRRAVAGGYEGYWEDATERAHLGQELAQAHWRATLGTTTQRLVHDFNNLLTGILSLSDAYLLRVGAENPAREGLQLINQNARQAADIVQQIAQLFRETPGQRSYQNVGALAGAAADMLRRVLPKHSSVKLDVRQDSIPVYVDAAELKQVIVLLGLTLAPAINLEVALQGKEAHLKIGGMTAEPSQALLVAQAFAERNGAQFSGQNNEYIFRFPEADFLEAERQPRSILLLRTDDDAGFELAELLRRNSYEVVIGDHDLLRSPDYRFDAVWVRGETVPGLNPKVRRIVELQEGASSLLEHNDVVLPVGIGKQDMLAKLRDAFRS
jgi:hypothetical protein